jgi:large subunit ribosomal protein L21
VYAIISDRGRQANVHVGDVIDCDLKQELAIGDSVSFERVLLVSDEGEVRVGEPEVSGARVTGEVLAHVKGPKLTVFRFKRRKNVRAKTGHRQGYTRVKITGIEV